MSRMWGSISGIPSKLLSRGRSGGEEENGEEEDDFQPSSSNGFPPFANGTSNGDDSMLSLTQAFEDKVRPLIDLVDELRCYGLDQDISLPSVVVIGDQSSGKSSILEAISGIQLPRGSGIVTRCPLEMQLKRSKSNNSPWNAELSYKSRSKQQMKFDVSDPEDLETMIRQAQTDITGETNAISQSLITLKVESPNCPDLTLIDLPGIARTAVLGQPRDICHQIKQLIKNYTNTEHTVMLCVIPCNVDIATNEALSLAREVDPHGVRTLGVLTKPDLIDPGTETEILPIINNERFPLQKGYSIVRCRGQNDINNGISLDSALHQEKEFFQNHSVFSTLNEAFYGTHNLALKLTDNLVEHIERTIPKLRMEVEEKYDATCKELGDLANGPPESRADKRVYLLQRMEAFNTGLDDAIVKGNAIPSSVITCDHKVRTISEFCRASYQWRVRFVKFKTELTNITQKQLGHSGELSVSKIEEKLDVFRGPELPRFMSFELFKLLLQGHLDKYLKPARDCLTEMNSDLTEVTKYLCEKHFAHMPDVKGKLLRICSQVRQDCKTEGLKELDREMKRERQIYTQDDTYMKQLKSIQTNVPEGESTQLQAIEMHQLVITYLTIANARIIDNIPMLIRASQHEDFMVTLRERLIRVFNDDNIDKLVREDPSTAGKRKQLMERSRRLSVAIEKLNSL